MTSKVEKTLKFKSAAGERIEIVESVRKNVELVAQRKLLRVGWLESFWEKKITRIVIDFDLWYQVAGFLWERQKTKIQSRKMKVLKRDKGLVRRYVIRNEEIKRYVKWE